MLAPSSWWCRALVAAATVACLAPACTQALDFDGYSYATAAGGGASSDSCDLASCPAADDDCHQPVCEGDACSIAPRAAGASCSDGGTVCDGDGNCVPCNDSSDCGSDEVCQDHECVPETCTNEQLDPGETDVDCGGVCAPCGNGQDCMDPEDCQSRFCDPMTMQCAPCSSNFECPNGWCDNGTCTPYTPIGEPCSGGNECDEECRDGVCCSGDCEGNCQACSEAKTGMPDGQCANIPDGMDPDDECPGSSTCDGNRNCTAACGVAPTPPGGSCPSECTGGCNNNNRECVISCTGSSCTSAMLTCPAGFDCRVDCTGSSGCEFATVTCPSTYDCEVHCDGSSSCTQLDLNCADGPCDIYCASNGSSCDGAKLNCGSDACTATCGNSSMPAVTCGSSCMCTTC